MAPRFSQVRSDTIEYCFWLTLSDDGSISLTRGRPTLGPRQRGMSCTLNVPRSIFKTPQLRAEITIADPGAHEANIDISAAADALRRSIGCDVHLTINEGETR